MVDKTRELEFALGDGVKRIEKNELNTVVVQRRSIRANKNLKKGTKLNENHFEYLRPCPKTPYDQVIKNLINKKVKKEHQISRGNFKKGC